MICFVPFYLLMHVHQLLLYHKEVTKQRNKEILLGFIEIKVERLSAYAYASGRLIPSASSTN